MRKLPVEVIRVHAFEKGDPACMQSPEQGQGKIRIGAHFRGLSPGFFVISLNGRVVFCQGPLGTDVSVQVAVGNMVNYLSPCPPFFPVRRIELAVAKLPRN